MGSERAREREREREREKDSHMYIELDSARLLTFLQLLGYCFAIVAFEGQFEYELGT